MNPARVSFPIVLVAPEIPQNTGTIGRMCVSVDCPLHLVKPLGFSLEDKFVKRAGMDYWPWVDLHVHENWDAFLDANPGAGLHFFSTHAETLYWDVDYRPGDCLVFGRESAGLPPEFYERYRDRLRLIPMTGRFYRSLNLANSVSIALYEALRQNRR